MPALGIHAATIADRDLDGFARFVVDHVAESGRGGSLHFSFSQKTTRDEVKSNALTRWARGLNEPNWGRAWLLWDEEPRRVVGHIELRGGRLEAELHRATLGMGLLRAFTGQGWGGRLIETTVTWAKSKSLAWIDLGVFKHNAPARKLYARNGFVEQGVRDDAFRIDGFGTVDDVLMSLDLRPAAR